MPTDSDRQGFSIGYIARLSNLSTHTIRAWERRYKAVSPVRSEGGTRRYSQADLLRLQLLKAAVEAGHRISDVVGLDNDGVSDLVRESTVGRLSADQTGQNFSDVMIDPTAVDTIVEAARNFDVADVERQLNVQYRLLGPSRFRRHLCGGLLKEMGVLWEAGNLSIAAEHLISEAVKKVLMRIIDDHRPEPGAPKIIFTTPAEEYHELGLLIAAGVAAEAGAYVLNLGPRLPVEAVVEAAETSGAAVVALSACHLARGSQRAYLTRLRGQLVADVEIWLGGAMAVRDVDGCTYLGLDEMVGRIDTMRTS